MPTRPTRPDQTLPIVPRREISAPAPPPATIEGPDALSRRASRDVWAGDPEWAEACGEDGAYDRPTVDFDRLERCGDALTRGRRYLAPKDWNAWADMRIAGLSKGKDGVLASGTTLTVSGGIDNRVARGLVVGLSGMASNGETDSFGGLLVSDIKGFSIGPYLAWQFAEGATFDLSASWGTVDNSIRLFGLVTRFDTEVVSVTGDVTFDTMLGDVALRPRVGLSYTDSSSEAHRLRGIAFGRVVDLPLGPSDNELASLETALEAAVPIATGEGLLIPFVEAGWKYDFLRPEGASFDTSTNVIASPSEWSGQINLGLRYVPLPGLYLELSGAYRSIGAADTDVWDAGLFVSFAF